MNLDLIEETDRQRGTDTDSCKSRTGNFPVDEKTSLNREGYFDDTFGRLKECVN